MKPLNFALIGAGRFGKHYIRLLKNNKRTKLAAICTKTNDSLKEISKTLPKYTITTTDADSVLENKKIDCAIIATPLSTHYELAMKAINEGKHVILEKPMVQTDLQAKRLSVAIKKASITFMVDHQYVYNDCINYIKKKHEKNFFGKIQRIEAKHLYYWPRKDVGCFWDAGTHQLAVIQYLFNPGKISKISGKAKSSSGSFFDDATDVSLKFENNIVANISISSVYPIKSRKFEFIGEKQMAIFDDSAKKPVLKISQKNFLPQIIKINSKEPLKNELGHFIHCIQANETPKTGISESMIVTDWLVQISKKLKISTKKKK